MAQLLLSETLDQGMYTQVLAVPGTTFGVFVPCGLGEGTDLFSACPYVRCTQISAGWRHTVLLRNDGTAVACGENGFRQCDIPTLADGMSYTQA